MLWLASAHATTVSFPGTYASLQEAVDELLPQSGDHVILLDTDVSIDLPVSIGAGECDSITIRPALGQVSVFGTADPMFDLDTEAALFLEELELVGLGNRLAITRAGSLEIAASVARDFGDPAVDGGVVHVRNDSVLRLIHSHFENNTGRDGAIAEVDGAQALLESIGSSYLGNVATEDGGAFDIHGQAAFEGNVFTANSAGSSGGALNVESGTHPISITASSFEANTASRGGAVFAFGRDVVVEGSSFEGNVADAPTDEVGGALMITGNDGHLTVLGCEFNDNHANRGAAVYGRNGATLVVQQSLLCENTGTFGAFTAGSNAEVTVLENLFWSNGSGGIELLDNVAADGLVERNTFVANPRATDGQAAFIAGSAPPAAFNDNLVVDHSGVAVVGFARSGTLFHGNSTNSSGGNGNGELEDDPVFFAPAACSFDSVRVWCDGPAGNGTDAVIGAAPCLVDDDGDGFDAANDCNDTDADVFPGADEICNGVDDDCNGETDEDETYFTSWYLDADGDGYGAGHLQESCAPLGAAAVDGDCDDARMDAFPGAHETCNQLDDDCDGTVDEDAVDAGTWFPDADGDGWGQDPAGTGCPTEQAATASGDCDDFAPHVNPGATEVCNGIDDDCSGAIDEGFPVRNRYLDADGDGFGDPAITTIDCQLPPGWTTVADDCDDDRAQVNPDAVEDCHDPADNDCDGLLDDDDPDSARSFWPDADGDGHGALGSNPLLACEAPPGQAADATDCDDGDPLVHPGAEEDPTDGIDSNCDGARESDPIDALGLKCNQAPGPTSFAPWLRR